MDAEVIALSDSKANIEGADAFPITAAEVDIEGAKVTADSTFSIDSATYSASLFIADECTKDDLHRNNLRSFLLSSSTTSTKGKLLTNPSTVSSEP